MCITNLPAVANEFKFSTDTKPGDGGAAAQQQAASAQLTVFPFGPGQHTHKFIHMPTYSSYDKCLAFYTCKQSLTQLHLRDLDGTWLAGTCIMQMAMWQQVVLSVLAID